MLKYSINICYDKIDEIFVASVPELRGCMAHGATREEALHEIDIAIDLWLEAAKKVGEQIPEPLTLGAAV